MTPAEIREATRFAALPNAAQWGLLAAGSAGLGTGLHATGLPAALLLGPMIAGIAAGVLGARIRLDARLYAAAQAIIGCMIAATVTPDILASLAHGWPLYAAIVLATIFISTLLGWIMKRWQILPGTTAVWGMSAGAAGAMIIMAEAYGADARLVAFMQYVRVVAVALCATIVAHIWVGATGAAAPAQIWFPPLHWVSFGETLALAATGVGLGLRFKLPAGSLIIPMLAGALLHSAGLVDIELPQWLLTIAYTALGWRIGLSFTGQVLAHATRALPQIIVSTLVLVGFGGGLGFLLSRALGIDPLTAYLATSPGGLDSVAIIAASSPVDVAFVMALQTARFFLVSLLAPSLARILGRGPADLAATERGRSAASDTHLHPAD